MKAVSINSWLKRETPRHTALLTALRERLEAALTDREDADGYRTLADLNERGTPSRDWCRAYQRYQAGYEKLMSDRLENLRLQLQLTKVPTEQLEAQFRAELEAAARSWTPEQWKLIDEVRK